MANDFTLGGMPVTLNVLVTEEYTHERVHLGESFMAHYYGGTVAGGGTLMLSVAAGTVSPHLLYDVSVGGDARLRITEGGTLTGGTAVTVFNMNRNHAGSCLSTVKHSGTLTGGTVIYDIHVSGGEGVFSSGGGARAGHEFMARVSKTTAFEIVNLTTAYPASIGVVFYEDNE